MISIRKLNWPGEFWVAIVLTATTVASWFARAVVYFCWGY